MFFYLLKSTKRSADKSSAPNVVLIKCFWKKENFQVVTRNITMIMIIIAIMIIISIKLYVVSLKLNLNHDYSTPMANFIISAYK